MNKILTILGTRPEFIRLSMIIPKLDVCSKQILVHTGQNYDYELNKIFFKELSLRRPNYYLGAKGTFGKQISIILKKLEEIIIKEKPNKFLVLGDTNSSLGSIIAKRFNIKVYHLEAGNRSFNPLSPEEVNRKIIDHTSDILMPYTQRSSENLIAEGFHKKKIYVVGNPIYEVINKNINQISNSNILKKLNLKQNNYFLVTLHREENVDEISRFLNIIKILNLISVKFKKQIIWPIHPRSLKNLKKNKMKLNKNIKLIKPLGFFDFVKLEQDSKCILTDSGTVQEEASIFKKPCIVLRTSTERQETLESGATIVDDAPETIIENIKFSIKFQNDILSPADYEIKNTSTIVTKIINSLFF